MFLIPLFVIANTLRSSFIDFCSDMPVNNQSTNLLETPVTFRGSQVTNSIQALTNILDGSGNDDEPNAKCTKYLKFTPSQLSHLIHACTAHGQTSGLANRNPTTITSIVPLVSSYFNNAKYDDIICKPIKPIYNGSEADLMLILLWLDIWRQDDGGVPAMYLTIDDNTMT